MYFYKFLLSSGHSGTGDGGNAPLDGVFFGRNALEFTKYTGEIEGILKACGCGNFLNCAVRLVQQLAGALNAVFQQKALRGFVITLDKVAVEAALADGNIG